MSCAGAQTLEERVRTLEEKSERGATREDTIRVRFEEGIRFEDPHGNWSLRLGGRVQLDYRDFSPSGTVADTFSLRRVRAGFDATLYTDFRIVVDAEFANGSATGSQTQNTALTLGYLDIGSLGPAARIRLGQFKPAFGYEQTLLDLYSDYMERSFAQSLLQNLNYDRGVMLYGAPMKGVWYGVTLSNGTGQNLEERQSNAQEVDAASKEITSRLTGNFAPWFDMPDRILQIGGSFKRGRVANSDAAPYTAASVQSEARGATFFTPAAFNAASGATVSNVDRRFVAWESLFASGPVKLQGEIVQVKYSATRFSPTPESAFDRTLKAGYVTVMWILTGEHYADFFKDSTIGKIKPLNRFSKGSGGGWGAMELGLRYSCFDGSDFSDSNPLHTGRLAATSPAITSTDKARATTLQAKWIPNIYTRFWIDLVRTRFASPVLVNGIAVSRETAVNLRAQMDF